MLGLPCFGRISVRSSGSAGDGVLRLFREQLKGGVFLPGSEGERGLQFVQLLAGARFDARLFFGLFVFVVGTELIRRKGGENRVLLGLFAGGELFGPRAFSIGTV